MLYLIIILTLWELYWTITACWLASRRGDKGWFIFFLIFNLLGIPEIIYVRKYKNSLSNPNERYKEE
jgi:dolichyl-phosphate-mannose--protein O-mannosyl transferase